MCKEVLKYDELLAEKLRAFMKDIDFYEYEDACELGETDEDRVAREARFLQSVHYCKGVVMCLQSYADENPDSREDCQKMIQLLKKHMTA